MESGRCRGVSSALIRLRRGYRVLTAALVLVTSRSVCPTPVPELYQASQVDREAAARISDPLLVVGSAAREKQERIAKGEVELQPVSPPAAEGEAQGSKKEK